MKDPSSLPEDIYRLLADGTDQVSEENIELAGNVFKEILRTRLAARPEVSGEDVLRFSSLGKKDRQLWYAANKPEAAEALPPKTKLNYLIGDVWEIVLLFLAKEAGHTVTDEQYEVEEDGVHGHIDARIDGVLVDVKSASDYSFNKFVSGEILFDDPFGYVPQLAGYSHKMGTERAGWFVGNKKDGGLAYVELDKKDIAANPPATRISTLRKVIAQETPPSRCYSDVPEGKSGNRKLSVGCSYCSFKDTCWADANSGQGLRKFFYSRGPVWLTHTVKLPKVDEA